MARTYHLGGMRRLVNRVVGLLLPLGLGPRSTYLLTTTGRRSGVPRTTPVTLVEGADGRWLVAPYGAVAWVWNVRADPEVTLRRGRRTLLATAVEVDPPRAAPVLQRYVRQVAVTRPFFDAGPLSSVDDFASEVPGHPVFAVQLRAASPGAEAGRRAE
jgi:deazaflavin-dependent oxidoreductase (nitroreductase family)